MKLAPGDAWTRRLLFAASVVIGSGAMALLAGILLEIEMYPHYFLMGSAAAFVIGGPLFLLARRLNWTGWLPAMVAGFLAGLGLFWVPTIVGIDSSFDRSAGDLKKLYWFIAIIIGLFGTVGALVFRLALSAALPQPDPDETVDEEEANSLSLGAYWVLGLAAALLLAALVALPFVRM